LILHTFLPMRVTCYIRPSQHDWNDVLKSRYA